MNFLILSCLIVYCLICSYTDIKDRRISNPLTYSLLVIMLVFRIASPMYYLALFPAILFFLLYLIKPHAIGAGDIKMMAVLGLCLGPDIATALFGMSATACLYIIAKKIQKKSKKSIPLAPFLTFGVLLVIIVNLSPIDNFSLLPKP